MTNTLQIILDELQRQRDEGDLCYFVPDPVNSAAVDGHIDLIALAAVFDAEIEKASAAAKASREDFGSRFGTCGSITLAGGGGSFDPLGGNGGPGGGGSFNPAGGNGGPGSSGVNPYGGKGGPLDSGGRPSKGGRGAPGWPE